nr:MAG TPA: hypothetical protein [Caudoviricetes sp.]DAQ75739.1 MAG TPA: hypothetical protein [Caudoviricetes sp.]
MVRFNNNYYQLSFSQLLVSHSKAKAEALDSMLMLNI